MAARNGNRVARAVARRIRGLLTHRTAVRHAPDDREPFLYPWLNAKFKEIAADPLAARKPQYIWGTLQGATLAQALGIPRVSVIEFGVAGGNGLAALERVAEKVEALCGVGIDVYGFDTGRGLPRPEDYRDLPNLYGEGHFPMNPDALRARLKKARLILGPVADTVPRFLESEAAPVAFASIDVDLYTSTVDVLKLFESGSRILLPRVFCYFDDIFGFTFSEFTGERLAIREFNEKHSMRKISLIPGLKYFLDEDLRTAWWAESIYIAHIFEHELYARSDGLSRLTNLDLHA